MRTACAICRCAGAAISCDSRWGARRRRRWSTDVDPVPAWHQWLRGDAVTAPTGPQHGTPLLRAELRSKGYRLTAQRQLVLEAVAQIGHATPEQVLAAVQQKAAGVNISTVYRTLYLLEELGLVRHTHLGHGASTFSVTDQDEHIHLVCRDCAAVSELAAGVVVDLAARLTEQQGFILDIGHAALFGTCADCARPSS